MDRGQVRADVGSCVEEKDGRANVKGTCGIRTVIACLEITRDHGETLAGGSVVVVLIGGASREESGRVNVGD